MSNLSRRSPLIGARLLAPEKGHEGLSGRGTHWGEAPGFPGGLAALQELRNVPFLAGPGPPRPPANATHVAFPQTETATNHLSSAAGAELLPGEQASGGRAGQLLSGARAWARVGGFVGPNFGATGPEPPGTIGGNWLFPRLRAPIATGPRPTFAPAGRSWEKHVMAKQDGSRPNA